MSSLAQFSNSFFATMAAILSNTFILAMGLLFLSAVVFYVIDITQTRHTIRRNYPLIGRFRYSFEKMGEFFRQYLYSMVAPQKI